MTVEEIYKTVEKFMNDLNNIYGDHIECVEVYDGNIVVHFKKEYVEEKITEMLIRDLIQAISKTIWGMTNE